MSYSKAMKHSGNVRKCRKQAWQYMGFDTGSGRWPSPRSNPEVAAIMDIREWMKWRNLRTSREQKQYTRECVRDRIRDLREIRAAKSAG